jgi:hypothetical protein
MFHLVQVRWRCTGQHCCEMEEGCSLVMQLRYCDAVTQDLCHLLEWITGRHRLHMAVPMQDPCPCKTQGVAVVTAGNLVCTHGMQFSTAHYRSPQLGTWCVHTACNLVQLTTVHLVSAHRAAPAGNP